MSIIKIIISYSVLLLYFLFSIECLSYKGFIRDLIVNLFINVFIERWLFKFNERSIVVQGPSFANLEIFLEKISFIYASELNIWYPSFSRGTNNSEHIRLLLGLLSFISSLSDDSNPLSLYHVFNVFLLHSLVFRPILILFQLQAHWFLWFLRYLTVQGCM